MEDGGWIDNVRFNSGIIGLQCELFDSSYHGYETIDCIAGMSDFMDYKCGIITYIDRSSNN